MKIKKVEFDNYEASWVNEELKKLGYENHLDVVALLYNKYGLKKDRQVISSVITGNRIDNSVAQAILEIIQKKIKCPIAS